MRTVLDVLFLRTWWSYERDRGLAFSAPYHWFNIFEGCAWLIFAALVLSRFARHRHSQIELSYALAFFTFGLSDFYEASLLTSWLLWLKAFNLAALLVLRRRVIKGYYPANKLY